MTPAAHIVIRPARLSDALAIAALHHVAVHGLAAAHYPREVLTQWSPPVTLSRAERLYRETQDDGGLTMVAERDGNIVGFGVAIPGAGEISACYVAPDATRQGVGRLLLRAMEAAIAAEGVHELRVRASLNAKNFYSAFGYHVSGRGEHRFEDGTPMVVAFMRKDNSPLG
jgi:ribosomal protein S18 acetylase RimI-like enzyme